MLDLNTEIIHKNCWFRHLHTTHSNMYPFWCGGLMCLCDCVRARVCDSCYQQCSRFVFDVCAAIECTRAWAVHEHTGTSRDNRSHMSQFSFYTIFSVNTACMWCVELEPSSSSLSSSLTKYQSPNNHTTSSIVEAPRDANHRKHGERRCARCDML